MTVISVKVTGMGEQRGIAIDGNWAQDQIDRVVPDRLQFVPIRKGKVEIRKPTKVFLRKGNERTCHEVDDFEIEKDANIHVSVRHYTLGAEIEE